MLPLGNVLVDGEMIGDCNFCESPNVPIQNWADRRKDPNDSECRISLCRYCFYAGMHFQSNRDDVQRRRSVTLMSYIAHDQNARLQESTHHQNVRIAGALSNKAELERQLNWLTTLADQRFKRIRKLMGARDGETALTLEDHFKIALDRYVKARAYDTTAQAEDAYETLKAFIVDYPLVEPGS